MIFKSSSPLSPNVEISINNVPTDYMQMQRVIVEEEENKHTMVTIDVSGLAPDILSDYIDKPIKIKINFNGVTGIDFVGYIVFLEPTSVTNDGLVDNSPFQITRMYCMSASYIMKSKKSKSWENVTISDIALSIADTYKLSVAVPKDPYRFIRLVQTNQSDWEFLVNACKKLGYSITITGTHLHIWDPFKLLGRNISYAVLQSLKGSYGNVVPTNGQILSFEGQIGAVTSSASRTSDILHILDKDGLLMSLSSSVTDNTSGLSDPLESMFKNTLNVNVDNYEMGKRLVEGALRKKFSNTAKVIVTSSPEIRPGSIVKIDKYNSKLDGFWYVKSTKHELTKSELITTLMVATDGTTLLNPVYNTVEEHVTPPTPSLLSNIWVSSIHSAVIYS
jgi:hypothetical protein